MRRVILLSSLSVGRCFTSAETRSGVEEEERAAGLAHARTILEAEVAWRVTGSSGESFTAESATGEVRDFAATTKVVEIPRQGWDRLAERARSAAE